MTAKLKSFLMHNTALLIALALCIFAGGVFSSPKTYRGIYETLDKQANVTLGIAATASGVSIGLTALPDDIATPIAEKLSDIEEVLMIVVVSVLLQKYILTILGAALFQLAFPLLLILRCYTKKASIVPASVLKAQLVIRSITILLIAVYLAVPLGAFISNHITATWSESINAPIREIIGEDVIEYNTVQELQEEEGGNFLQRIGRGLSSAVKAVGDRISSTIDSIKDSVDNAINWGTNFLRSMIEATAVLIVTNCVIPIAVLLLMIFCAKQIIRISTHDQNTR